MANHVAFFGEAGAVAGVAPAWADHRRANAGCCQSVVDALAPLAGAEAGDVAKYLLAAEGDPQPVIEPAAGVARVVAAIADENTVTCGVQRSCHSI
jgi:hypothetical protein